MPDITMRGSISSPLVRKIQAKLDLLIEQEKETLSGGAMDLPDYKRRTGIIAGLRLAKRTIDEVETQAMRE